MTRCFLTLLSIFGVCVSAERAWSQTSATPSSQHGMKVDFRMRCGVDKHHVDSQGNLYEADREYGAGSRPYRGYVGGLAFRTRIEPSGTDEPTIYMSTRIAFDEYRFDVPAAGMYLVRLHLNEILFHGRDQNVFSLDLEGERAIESLDLWERYFKDYAVDYTFVRQVTDGTLNISLSPEIGTGALSAITVRSIQQDANPPAAPTDFSGIGGFRTNILTWAKSPEPDLAGYHVYRFLGGQFVRLDADLVRIERFLDESVSAGESGIYRVTAVDVWGNESADSEVIQVVAVGESDSRLPVYKMVIDPADLDFINELWYENHWVACDFTGEGQFFPGMEARIRGNFSRLYAKKSWRIKFPGDSPFDARERLNLNSMSTDRAMLREKLAMDLFQSIKIPSPKTQLVHLELNGTFMGVFLDIEDMRQEFVERVGLNPDGTLYRGDDTLKILPTADDYALEYEKKTNEGGGLADLVEFIEVLNNTSDEEFPIAIRHLLDVEKFLDYYALVILIARNDFTYSDYYLFDDPATDRWMMLPWDNDESFGNIGGPRDGYVFRWDLPIDYGSADSSEIAGGDRPNVLVTRMMRVDAFRDYFADQLVQWIVGFFNNTLMDPAIDALYQQIAFDAHRDLLKWGREDDSFFDGGPGELKTFVQERGAFLLGEIPGYAPGGGPYVSLNEVMAVNQSTITDGAGDFDPWFEIFNEGVEELPLGGLYLTDDLSQKTKFQIPNTIRVGGGSWILFWGDGETHEGDTHTNFVLNPSGGELYLIASDGQTELSRLTYASSGADLSFGVVSDGGDTTSTLPMPTPAQANYVLNPPPVVHQSSRTPQWPSADEAVLVTAQVSDDRAVSLVQVVYEVDDVWSVVSLHDDGQHGDGSAGDGVYGGTLPGQPLGTPVRYYVEAHDDGGRSGWHPAEAPNAIHAYEVGYTPPPLWVNEFMADNDTTLADNAGEYDDWIEIYNSGPTAVDLSGMTLSDDLSEPDKWAFPDGTVLGAGQWLLVWADDNPSQGPLHATFKLDKDGEQIGLFDTEAHGHLLLDAIHFGPQQGDVSYGRYPDGSPNWIFMNQPTPGTANQN